MSTIQTPGTGGSDSPIDGIEIRLLHHAEEMRDVVDVFQQVWGSITELVPLEMLMAIAHSGGYVCGAYEAEPGGEERILGASVGFLARHDDAPALHSHITGLLPGARFSGLGRAIKLHQRAWALEHGIEWIVWTFDPLVRRNAWFNIAVLGAEVHGYHESFYGKMTDAINAGDESDRLVIAWRADPGAGGHGRPHLSDAELVPTPEDIVTLRRTDPEAAARWRADTRRRLSRALAEGRRIVGFTRDGEYVVEPGG